MAGLDLLVIVVFFLIGYGLISYFWPTRPRATNGSGKGNSSGAKNADSFGADNYENRRNQPESSDERESTWYDVLGVNPQASAEEIHRAYRVKIGKYHPDKVAQMGPELQILAGEMTQKINVAYEQALKLRS